MGLQLQMPGHTRHSLIICARIYESHWPHKLRIAAVRHVTTCPTILPLESRVSVRHPVGHSVLPSLPKGVCCEFPEGQDPPYTHLCVVQVGRVAFAALAACAVACGQKFEYLSYSLMPELFKQLVVSIVVVADAADACMRAFVTSCHSGRILKLFTDVMLNDKNPKLRQRCAEYMHQALQEWPPAAFAREQQQLVRMGVTKAIEDASAGTALRSPSERNLRVFDQCACIASTIQAHAWHFLYPKTESVPSSPLDAHVLCASLPGHLSPEPKVQR